MKKVLCWWSGGVTSAVARKLAIDLYGKDKCRVIFIDTKNEDDDTYRFLKDCEKWYGLNIEFLKNNKYGSIEDVWYQHLSLNVAKGAKCSSELKRMPRIMLERKLGFDFLHQVFGFDIDEPKRAKTFAANNKKAKAIFPLLLYGLTKKDCINFINKADIEIPRMYKLGFTNNNCFKTGCIQGGIGYWKKIQKEYPSKFTKMANIEHDLTNLKGSPVTILKDQSKAAKESGQFKVFLVAHPDYPNHKSIEDMEGREVENLLDCNGFCGVQGNLFNQLNHA